MQRIGVLNGNNITYDHDISGLVRGLTDGGVIQGGEISGGKVQPVQAVVSCQRSNGQKLMLYFESDEQVAIPSSGTFKVYIEVDQSKIDDGTGNAENGTGIASIKTGPSVPSQNSLLLASVADGQITDERNLIPKIQSVAQRTSTLEEKMTTTEGQISQLVEAGTPSYLGITAIVGEKYTMEDTLFLQKTPKLADSVIAINVGDIDKNKEIHIQRIGSGTASNQLKLKMKKFGAPTTSVIVEVRKGVKVDVSEKEAYRYGGEVIASTTIAYTEFLTEWKEFTLTLNNQFGGNKGELLDIVVYQQGGIVNGTNYYQIACDSTQYSESFSVVAVNGNSRVRSRLMPYCVSDCFLSDAFVKAGIINKINITNTIPFVSDGWNLVYSNNGDFIYSKKIHQGIPADIKNTIDVGCFFHADLTITPSNNYRFIFGGMLSNNAINYPGGLNALKTMRSSIGNSSTKVDFSLSAEGLDISKDIYAYFGYATTARYGESLLPFIQNAKLTINGTVSAYKADIKTRIGFASSIEEIGNPVKNIIFGVHEGRFIGEQIDPTITSTATTGYIPPVNAIGYMSIIGADGKRYKIRVYGE